MQKKYSHTLCTGLAQFFWRPATIFASKDILYHQAAMLIFRLRPYEITPTITIVRNQVDGYVEKVCNKQGVVGISDVDVLTVERLPRCPFSSFFPLKIPVRA